MSEILWRNVKNQERFCPSNGSQFQLGDAVANGAVEAAPVAGFQAGARPVYRAWPDDFENCPVGTPEMLPGHAAGALHLANAS